MVYIGTLCGNTHCGTGIPPETGIPPGTGIPAGAGMPNMRNITYIQYVQNMQYIPYIQHISLFWPSGHQGMTHGPQGMTQV